MRVKRYVADSLQEAIARVKADLGRDAIILHTKQFKEGGLLGLFAHRRYEVIAALDENQASVAERQGPSGLRKNRNAPLPAAVPPKVPAVNKIGLPSYRAAAPGAASQLAANAVDPEISSLRAEMREMKDLIREAAVVKPTVIIRERAPGGDPEAELREHLLALGLEPGPVAALLEDLTPKMLTGWPLPELLHYCRQNLTGKLLFAEPLDTGTRDKQRVISLIGPTGVGKTTTIAKLAAKFKLDEDKRVGLITLDTYRIAAVEHLMTYGDIMNLPVEVVYTAADLEPAIAKLHYCDVILVDTAGRSPRNQLMMDELHTFIAKPVIETILLVISATTQYRDMVTIEENFSRIAYTHLVFTKLDETDNLGPLISLMFKCQRPLSYLTAGQNVPDDIETVQLEKLVTQLFEGLSHG
ncbi:MAG: flagellar biosynthesis protein FlhF [Bacillota bacterium]|jgi:flagellar biosynthesis protein FlhF